MSRLRRCLDLACLWTFSLLLGLAVSLIRLVRRGDPPNAAETR